MYRRHLLAFVATLPILAGCGTTPTINSVANDVQVVSAGLKAIAPSILTAIGTDKVVADKFQSYMDTITAGASSIVTATSATSTSIVQQVIAAVQAIAPLVLSLVGLPASIVTVIQAAVAMLPSIAAAVGLTLAMKATPTMTPAAARLILQGAARG